MRRWRDPDRLERVERKGMKEALCGTDEVQGVKDGKLSRERLEGELPSALCRQSPMDGG